MRSRAINRCVRLHAFAGVWVVALLLLVALWPATGASASRQRPNRLIVIKVDGLPPDLLAAAAFPERDDLLKRLPYAEEFRRAVHLFYQQTGRESIMPNARRYFFEQGVVCENMFASTLTLSAASWSVIDTGQPSVIKKHGTFSRDTGYLRSHLDGFRDTWDALRYRGEKTSAVWMLDQIGVSLMLDAFDFQRTWTSPQIYQRLGNSEQLFLMGKKWLTNDQRGVKDIVRSHLSRLATGIDYTEFNQEVAAEMTAIKVLERDLTGQERYDYLSPYFTLMDHQQHVDPHPDNLIHWLVKLDGLIGRIFEAVERSQRRDETVVAMISDHGSDIKPGQVAFSLPITRLFRTPLFGSHTVTTLLVEDAYRALTTPVPGVDFPRVYESDTSPYGRKRNARGGEDGYVTAFIDNFGNGRADVNLRNNDLNRLHLILLELQKQPVPPQRFAALRRLFQQTLEETRRWLEPDLALFEDYHAGAKDFARQLGGKADNYSKDIAWRLTTEAERDAGQIQTLRRLLSIRFEPGQPGLLFDEVFSKPFRISDFIPKKYFGVRNTIYQLSHYTIGLDENLQWIETTVDPQGRPVPMNYFQILSDYKAANAPAAGLYNPFDLIAVKAPVPEIESALRAHGLLDAERALREVVWLKSTARRHPHKGGEALILQAQDGTIAYVPINHLQQQADGRITFSLADDVDPLGFLKGAGFAPGAAASPLAWMRQFHPLEPWLNATYRTEYGIAIYSLLDILNDPAPTFIDSPEFQQYLIYFSSDQLKQRYLRGLKRKYANHLADFIVWSNDLWNFNSKARTSGGSHAGLKPIVTRVTFVAWGGERTAIARGRTNRDVLTTLDVAPTLFRAIGMLDDKNRVIRDPASIPERTFHPFPGRTIDLWRTDTADQQVTRALQKADGR
ncbi:MAG: alkaline phosphatase family protein [Acidobacteriota bacterium]|nr:alkaline phosphatase family protein [Blastocatellia bacterium]MDW8238051.1 alkaline phosphatase family protein [Acidobacteriota bacterium]